MATATLTADQYIIDLIAKSQIDDEGLTLTGQLNRKEYEAVNKFLELAGAKWNRGKKRHIFRPGTRDKILALIDKGEIVNEKKLLQAFYTPASIANALVTLAGIGEGMDCLEPSAGSGSIAQAARKAGAKVYCVEINPEASKIVAELGFEVLTGDFLEIKPENASCWPRILMNPPFANDQDIKHVMHAFKFLLPGGRLYAIMGTGWQHGQNKTRTAFREFVDKRGSVIKELPEGTFKESGTMVATVIVELVRPSNEGVAI